MKRRSSALFLTFALSFLILFSFAASSSVQTPPDEVEVYKTDPADLSLIKHRTNMYEIRVIDADTGRGVPLVEFETLDGRHYFVTDSAGRIAINDSRLMDKEVIFNTKSHGYYAPLHKGQEHTYPMHGQIKLGVYRGKGDVIRIKRINIAERLYRITGAKTYEASIKLRYPVPVRTGLDNAQVKGQDGGIGTIYNGRIIWLWGDTGRTDDPVTGQPRWGILRSSGAYSDLPEKGGLDPSVGVKLQYFTRADGFVKDTHIIKDPEGAVWPVFLGVVEGKLLTYYTRITPDWKVKETGLAQFNSALKEYRSIHTFDLNETWRHPNTWGFIRYQADGKDWLYLGHASFINKRVPATINDLKNPGSYEGWSCLADGSSTNPWEATVLRDEEGKLVYRWTKDFPPIGPKEERELINAGKISPEEAWFNPVDVETGKLVLMHTGTVNWNPYRNKWIFIGVEEGGSNSFLGEVWYSESDSPTGPWKKAIKIITHDRYSFYNPSHLDFFDQDGGRIIYLNGCYSYSFSGTSPRDEYNDYNMFMYRLDLSDPRLQAVWE